MTLKIEFQIISPAQAKVVVDREGLLIGDFNNRPARQIKSYATDMAAARWIVNGDAIIYDGNGKLVDGRKRMLAAAYFGVSFPTFVITDIDPTVADYIDQHKRRTARDTFFVAGYDDATSLAATAATVVDIARLGLPSQQILTHANLLRLAEDNPEIRNVRREIEDSPLYDSFSPSDLAALVYLTRQVNAKQSAEFFDKLADAVRTRIPGSKDVFQVLATAMKTIQDEIDAGGSAGSSSTRYLRVVTAIKGWNAWRTNASPRKIWYDPKKEPDAPRLHGLPVSMFESYIIRHDPQAAGGDRGIEYVAKTKDGRPSAEIVTITPEQAMEMLLSNGPLHNGKGRNRSKSRATIDGYAREMATGNWKLTGQAIKFSKSGRLIDGQHRLEACVRANTPFTTVIMRDVDDNVFSTFDVAHQHTVANILKSRGETYGGSIQGALRLVWLYREVGLSRRHRHLKPNLSEMLDLFETYPQLSEYSRQARSTHYTPFKVVPSVLNALMLIFNEIDPKATPVFFERFASGANLDTNSPILKLRNKLLKLSEKRHLEVDIYSRMYMVCLAWNAFRLGKGVSFPTVADDIDAPPPFDKGAAPKSILVLGDQDAPAAPSTPTPAQKPASSGPKAPVRTDGGKSAQLDLEDDGWGSTPTS